MLITFFPASLSYTYKLGGNITSHHLFFLPSDVPNTQHVGLHWDHEQQRSTLQPKWPLHQVMCSFGVYIVFKCYLIYTVPMEASRTRTLQHHHVSPVKLSKYNKNPDICRVSSLEPHLPIMNVSTVHLHSTSNGASFESLIHPYNMKKNPC